MSARSACPYLAKNTFSQSTLLTLLIRKRVTHFLLSDNTLADLGVLTKVEYFPRFGPFAISWSPPRDAKNCDVCHAGGQYVTPVAICFQRCKPFTDGTVLMGTNQKEDSPLKMVHRVIQVMLTGCNVC